MGSVQSDRQLDYVDLISIGMLGVAVLLLVAIRDSANPIAVIITIGFVCGIGLAAGARLADATAHLSGQGDERSGHCRGTRP